MFNPPPNPNPNWHVITSISIKNVINLTITIFNDFIDDVYTIFKQLRVFIKEYKVWFMRPKNLELVYIVGNSWQNARKW